LEKEICEQPKWAKLGNLKKPQNCEWITIAPNVSQTFPNSIKANLEKPMFHHRQKLCNTHSKELRKLPKKEVNPEFSENGKKVPISKEPLRKEDLAKVVGKNKGLIGQENCKPNHVNPIRLEIPQTFGKEVIKGKGRICLFCQPLIGIGCLVPMLPPRLALLATTCIPNPTDSERKWFQN